MSHGGLGLVHDYHHCLQRWFRGEGDRAALFEALAEGLTPDFALVFPSGARLDRAALLENLADRFGKSPGFTIEIRAAEVVHQGPEHAVVAYEEHQFGAQSSAASNGRSSLALVVLEDDRWRWSRIQETALPR